MQYVIIADDVITGGSLCIDKIGEKVLYRQPRAASSRFSYSDVSAEWLIQICTSRSLSEVERPFSHRDRARWRRIRRHERRGKGGRELKKGPEGRVGVCFGYIY